MAIGFLVFYIWIHFYVIQFTKTWKKRNTYEKMLSISSAVLLVTMLAGL